VAINIIADFFNLINVSLFDTFTVLLIVGFIIWEIPRSVKVIADEYTKDLYPENTRVVDFLLLFVGIITIVFFMLDNNAQKIVTFLKTPGITSFFLILMIAIPLIIILGYLKRIFGRMQSHDSVTIFLTHAFLDLMHTIFQLSLAILFIPAAGFLLLGPR
jgi:hypothetical protein